MPYPPRRAAARTLLREVAPGLDALLVTDLINVRYLTGFTGSNAALLLHVDGDDADRFCTDGRYRTQVAHEVPDLPRLDRTGRARALAAAAPTMGGRSASSPRSAWTPRTSWPRRPRASTCPAGRAGRAAARGQGRGEIEALRRACAVADAALAELIEAGGLRPGRTEREVALDLDQRMRDSAPATRRSRPSSPPGRTARSRTTGRPRARAARRRLRQTRLRRDGRRLPLGHDPHLVLGKPAADWQREHLRLVARGPGGRSGGPGARRAGAEVDAAARDVIAAAGHGAQFAHGLGHGVGLQIHEAPSLARDHPVSWPPACAVTVEPGVYLPGRGGVRIEDSG